jgi:hypothetical protein
MGLPEGQVIEQAYVILLKLDKNKEVLVRNDWGKIGRTSKFRGSKSLLNMTLFLRITSGWVVSFTGLVTMVLATPSIWGNATDPSHQCRYMFKRGHSESVNRVPSTTIHHPSSIFMIATLIHMSQFVSTSTKSLAPFRVIDVGFIKALL